MLPLPNAKLSRLGFLAIAWSFGHFTNVVGMAAPIAVRVEGAANNWRLTRGGQPYLVRGVGGDGDWSLLKKSGGNSVRTWGHEKLGEQLDRAQNLGLTITAGIWLGQVRQGFDWSDASSLVRQRQLIQDVVRKHKDHPALLVWALGNEMEDGEGKNGAVWSEINNLARLVKSIDPSHPTMTVIAELGGVKVRNLHALCPDIDIVGINSYAGARSVAKRYQENGGTKPYLLTEFGPPGIWETQKDSIGVYRELSSTEKASWYRSAYQQNVVDAKGACLGSYAFLWGHKQEVTATWFSMILPGGERLGAVDELTELWTGKPPTNRCPTIDALESEGKASVSAAAGARVPVTLRCADPDGDKVTVTWQLFGDAEQYGSGGDTEESAQAHRDAVRNTSERGAEVRLPNEPGLYRLFATVRDNHGGAAVANLPLRVPGSKSVVAGKSVKLPLIVYGEESDPPTFAPSGWMGDAKAIKLDPNCTTDPFAGKTCLRCEFSAEKGWGGVAWQHPPQDWGDRKGGFDLTGAKQLRFHARGEVGGEEVAFEFGLINRDKPFFDTAKKSLGKIQLDKNWREFTIPLGDLKATEDLTRIKTGFVWTVASSGRPVVFFLDDIRWE